MLPLNKKIKALLFDLDGTLVDTMPLHFNAWKISIKKLYGITIKKKDFYPLEGIKLKKIAPIILKKYGFDTSIINYKELILLKEKTYLEIYKLKFYPSVISSIKKIKQKKIKLGIVTSGLKKRLIKSIPKKFLENFDVIITGDDSSKGKPSKQPFYMAMKKLKLSHDECIVVENAPLGIKSAKNAEMFCFAITSTLSKKYLKEADLIVPNFKSFYKCLLNILKNEKK